MSFNLHSFSWDRGKNSLLQNRSKYRYWNSDWWDWSFSVRAKLGQLIFWPITSELVPHRQVWLIGSDYHINIKSSVSYNSVCSQCCSKSNQVIKPKITITWRQWALQSVQWTSFVLRPSIWVRKNLTCWWGGETPNGRNLRKSHSGGIPLPRRTDLQ